MGVALALAAILQFSLGEASSPRECHNIINNCYGYDRSDVWFALAYKECLTLCPHVGHGGECRDECQWTTEGWWRVNRMDQVQVCLKRQETLYAFLQWNRDRTPDSTAITFLTGRYRFCLQKGKTKVHEFKRDGRTLYFDKLEEHEADECWRLSREAKMRTFTMVDDGSYGSATISGSCAGNARSINQSEVVKFTAPELLTEANSTVPDEATSVLDEGKESVVVLRKDPMTHAYKVAEKDYPEALLLP
mmetsp:Transcript_54860/g.128782  ORF Transcript_54860/g.128782 Transcript_54860/m.128782 type:complete len:248 (+) Transcript_54860:65-808(+)